MGITYTIRRRDSRGFVAGGSGVTFTLAAGTRGPQGLPGVGVPPGGTTGQVLRKRTGTDYDNEWVNFPNGLSIGATVTNGTAGRVLHVGPDGKLSDDPGFTYDAATDRLTAGGHTVNGAATTDPIAALSRVVGVRTGTTEFGFVSNNAEGFLSVSNGTIVGFGAHVSSADGTVFGSFSDHPTTLRAGNVPCVRVLGTTGLGATLVGYFNAGVPAVDGQLTVVARTSGTRGVTARGAASQTAALYAGQLISSTSAVRDCFTLSGDWADSTDATRTGRLTLSAYSTTTPQEGLRVEANSAGVRLGFFGGSAVAKPTVTGSRGGNAALASLLTQLASLGLITDSTTA